MAKETFLFGKKCRYYKLGYIYVPDDGSMAVVKDNGVYTKLKLEKDNGGLWAINKWDYRIPMADAVITCFCAPKPNDGKQHVIGFKDGDMYNCSKQNLYWQEYHYQHNMSGSEKLTVYESNVEVFTDGTVKVDGNVETPADFLYDPDLDINICITPHIRAKAQGFPNGKAIDIDDIMKFAGFVNGDDAGMKCPKILHRDKDWMNFSSDNLEWCEATDSRYTDYEIQKYTAMNKRIYELNPGKDIRDFMLYEIPQH